MYTTHHPCWDAKNRHDLPEELPFDYECIRSCIEIEPIPIPEPKAASVPEMTEDDFKEPAGFDEKIPSATLMQLMTENGVTPLEIRKAVAYKGHFPEDTPIVNYPADYIDGVLIGAWGQVFDVIKEMREKYLF